MTCEQTEVSNLVEFCLEPKLTLLETGGERVYFCELELAERRRGIYICVSVWERVKRKFALYCMWVRYRTLCTTPALLDGWGCTSFAGWVVGFFLQPTVAEAERLRRKWRRACDVVPQTRPQQGRTSPLARPVSQGKPSSPRPWSKWGLTRDGAPAPSNWPWSCRLPAPSLL